MQERTTESLVQHACEQAIRSRLRDLEDARDPGARTSAKRASLDLLQLALREDRLDGVQVRHLQQLVDAYEGHLLTHPLPAWPGAEAQVLREEADELAAIEVARARLLAQRDAPPPG